MPRASSGTLVDYLKVATVWFLFAVPRPLESIRDHFERWQSLRSMRRTEAQRRKARPERLRHSQSFASPSHSQRRVECPVPQSDGPKPPIRKRPQSDLMLRAAKYGFGSILRVRQAFSKCPVFARSGALDAPFFRSVTRRLQLRRSPFVRRSPREYAPIHELSRANFMHADEPMRTLLKPHALH
jgi:hypothetical protein